MQQGKRVILCLVALSIALAIIPLDVVAEAGRATYEVLYESDIEGDFIGNAVGSSIMIRLTGAYYVPDTGELTDKRPGKDVEYFWAPNCIFQFTGSSIQKKSDYYAYFSGIGLNDAGYSLFSNSRFGALPNGVIDQNGRVLLEPIYDELYLSIDDSFVMLGKRFGHGVFNTNYQMIDLSSGDKKDLVFDSEKILLSQIADFSLGSSRILAHGSVKGLRGIQGEYLTMDGIDAFGVLYDSEVATPFHNGYAVARSVNETVYKIINTNGEAIAAPSALIYYMPGDNGMIRFESESGDCGYVNTLGEIAIQPKFYYADDFRNGYAVASLKDQGCGLIDINGNEIIPFGEYEDLSKVSETGLVWARTKKGTISVLKVDVKGDTPVSKYNVDVINGKGSSEFKAGEIVTISANPPAKGKIFDKWITTSNNVTFSEESSENTTFIMPAEDVTITATYRDGSGADKPNEPSSPDNTATHTLNDAVQYIPYRVNLKKTFEKGVRFTTVDGAPPWITITEDGVLSGIPKRANNEFFTVKVENDDGSTLSANLTLTVQAAETVYLEGSTAQGYEITQRIPDMEGINGNKLFISNGQFEQFSGLYLDGEEMIHDTDYTVERGSTVVTVLERFLKTLSNGTHTIAMAFHGEDGSLKCAAQNFTITPKTSNSSDSSSGSSSGSTGGSSSSSSSSSYNNTPKIRVNNPDGGTVQGFYYGAVAITPKSGYQVASVTVNGSEISLPDNGKLTDLKANDEVVVTFESLTPPASANTPSVPVYTPSNQPSSGFVDVSPDAYYYDAAVWARNQGISKGEGGRRFTPNAVCTRAEMLTFLWRANQSPEPLGGGKRFTDVPTGAYYEKAVQWAADRQIVKGVGKKKFNPTDTITRAEAITFLYRANGSPDGGDNTRFVDVNSNAYYASAVQWAVNNKLAKGMGGKKFNPNLPCTRAQVVTFLYRDSGK